MIKDLCMEIWEVIIIVKDKLIKFIKFLEEVMFEEVDDE